MRKLVLGLLGAAALTAGSAPANAVVFYDTVDSFLLAISGSDFFGANLIGEPGAFAHQYDFIIGSDSAANSSVTTILLNSNDIDFSSILLNGFAFTQTGFDPLAENWELSAVNIGAGLNSLYVNGSVVGTSGNGSYAGVINVAAVPEPGTWAMMLLGFGAAGYAMRRRRKQVRLQVA